MNENIKFVPMADEEIEAEVQHDVKIWLSHARHEERKAARDARQRRLRRWRKRPHT